MHKGRLEAFSDGVLAIILTVMVLELRVPAGETWISLGGLADKFLSYVLSYIYLGIYWSNHHHMLQALGKVNGKILWANLHLLFWLSLIPFTTAWMGESHFAEVPVAVYGCVLALAGVAYWILEQSLIGAQGASALASAVGSDIKGILSVVIYLVAIACAFFQVWISCACYVAVAILWLIPDRRIEKRL